MTTMQRRRLCRPTPRRQAPASLGAAPLGADVMRIALNWAIHQRQDASKIIEVDDMTYEATVQGGLVFVTTFLQDAKDRAAARRPWREMP